MRIIRLCLIIILLPALAQAADLSVFAASSLSEVLREVTQSYQKQHPDTKIELHFAGSQALATQIEQGAPADLFISANTTVMTRLQKSGLVETPKLLLGNQLVLAVLPELAPQLRSIKDLARPGLLLVIGNRQVPIGSYTRQLFADLAQDPAYGSELVSRIEANIVSEENMVKAIVAKLLLGEVDAGIVYQSDLAADNAHQLVAISLPARHNPRASYPMAKISGRRSETTAKAEGEADDFTAFLFSPATQQLFAHQGFLTGVAP